MALHGMPTSVFGSQNNPPAVADSGFLPKHCHRAFAVKNRLNPRGQKRGPRQMEAFVPDSNPWKVVYLLSGIEVDEQVCTVTFTGPIRSRPTNEEMAFVPCHPKCDSIRIGGLQRVLWPIRHISI